MGELVRFEVGPGESVVVETDLDAVGVERVARRDADGVVSASARLPEAVAQVKPAITIGMPSSLISSESRNRVDCAVLSGLFRPWYMAKYSPEWRAASCRISS